MSRTGEDLGVDLGNLYEAGRYRMLVIADQFRAAQTVLDRVDGMQGLFQRDPALGGSTGPAFAPWEELRHEILRVLGQTATNTEDAGHALMMAADAYADTDEGARKKFETARAAADRLHGVTE